MIWFKRNPILSAVLILLVTAIGTEAWLLLQARQHARHAQIALEQKKQERSWLVRQSPAPSAKSQQAIEAEMTVAKNTIAELRAALKGTEPDWLAKPAPAKSIDAYFDIAAFVDKMRMQAARMQVVIKPDEHFGFATHANEGPEADLLTAVFRQRLILQRLLDEVLTARPRALLAVQREQPLTSAQRRARYSPLPAGNSAVTNPAAVSASHRVNVPADFFTPESRLSLERPGVVITEAFRLEFTGQTPALRVLLNSLATFKVPLIVRGVTVELLNTALLVAADSASLEVAINVAPVPLVTQNLSKFVVVVECVELIAAPPPQTP